MRRVIVVGVTVAAVAGAGASALAATGTLTGDASSGSAATHSSAQGAGGRGGHRLLRRALHRAVHGQVVMKHGSTYITHDMVHGAVTAVSATSISVRASDGFAETFTVSGSTHVRMRSDGHGTKSSISDVHDGDTVFVFGIGKGTAVARHVIDVQS